MTKHTPSPWFSLPGGVVLGGPLVEINNGRIRAQLAMVMGHHSLEEGEREANHALIGAAPDLLEAAIAQEQAEDAWNNCEECGGEGDWAQCGPCSDFFGNAIDLRRAAIAKAQGDSSPSTVEATDNE